MPTAESLQLYHPMSLQSMPNTPAGHHHHHSDYAPSSRSMLGLPVSRGSHQLGPASGMEFNQRHHMGLYSSGQGPHSAGPTSSHYMSSDVPLSAPPSLSNNPFSSHHPQNVYPSFNPSPRLSHSAQGEQQQPSQYFNDGHSHSGSAPGSGYATPQ